MTKKGTPVMPSSTASRSSARTSSANAPESSAARALSASTPTSAASSTSVSLSPINRPSTNYAAIRVGPGVGVELEAAELHSDIGSMVEPLEGGLKPSFADVAPGSNDVRPDLYLHSYLCQPVR